MSSMPWRRADWWISTSGYCSTKVGRVSPQVTALSRPENPLSPTRRCGGVPSSPTTTEWPRSWRVAVGDDRLFLAIWDGDERSLEQAVANGADPNAVRLPDNESALMAALEHGRVDMVSRLIDLGADVNLATPRGGPGLRRVRILLDAGVRADAIWSSDGGPQTPIDVARDYERQAGIDALTSPPPPTYNRRSEEGCCDSRVSSPGGADRARGARVQDRAVVRPELGCQIRRLFRTGGDRVARSRPRGPG